MLTNKSKVIKTLTSSDDIFMKSLRQTTHILDKQKCN